MVVRIREKIEKAIGWMAAVITLLVFLLTLWAVGRIFLFDTFTVPSSSMEPALQPGDMIIVDKTIIGPRIYTDFYFDQRGIQLQSHRMRGLRCLRHNDIIVFNYPFHDGHISFVINQVYVKRCIALPGDSIGIADGIYRNNNHNNPLGDSLMQHRLTNMLEESIDSTVLMKKHYDKHYHWTIKNMPSVYVPRKGDIISLTPKEAYLYKCILEWETGKKITIDWEHGCAFADGNPLCRHKFLHNYYFVAGDNVLDSQDSRYWGVIPEEYIVGVVGCVIH